MIMHTAKLARTLPEIVPPLNAIAEELERDCLALGSGLESAIELLSRLGGSFQELQQEIDGDRIKQAGQSLSGVATILSGVVEELRIEQAGLAELRNLNQHADRAIDRLRASVRVISILAANVRIVTAGIDIEGENFSIFAQEIRTLTDAARKDVDDYSATYQALSTGLEQAAAYQAKFESDHADTLKFVGIKLRSSVDTMTERHHYASAAAAEIGTRSNSISMEIGNIIIGLQIGDSSRQRIEHIVHALTALQDRLAGAADFDGDADDALVSAATCQLQAAQLYDVQQDMSTEFHRILSALDRLGDDALIMTQVGNNIYGSGTGTQLSFLEDLEKDLQRAESMIRDCGLARAKVDAALTGIAGTLDDLLARLEIIAALEFNMRLVALNMSVKAREAGANARVVRVIADELHGYANETYEAAGALRVALENVAAAAQRFAAERKGQGIEKLATLQDELSQSLHILGQSGSQTTRALSFLSEAGEDIRRVLDRSLDTATAIAADERLPAIQNELDEIGGPELSFVEFSQVKDAVSTLTAKYTMASERQIEDQIFAPRAAE